MSISDINNKRALLNTALEAYKTALDSGDQLTIDAALNEVKLKGNAFSKAVGSTAAIDIPGAFFTGTNADQYFSDPINQDNELRIFVRDALLAAGVGPSSDAMVWVVDTTANSLDSTLVTLPFRKSSNVTVDWGDGNVETVSEMITHNYTTGGVKTISMTGNITGFDKSPNSEQFVLKDISQWGNIDIDEYTYIDGGSGIFRGIFLVDGLGPPFAARLGYTISATDAPTFKAGTSLIGLFIQSEFNSDISHWDVSNVVSMEAMFTSCSVFNQDISGWDVSGVTNMEGMFNLASSFNQNISGWDVSNVTNYTNFSASSALTAPNTPNFV